MSLMETWNSFKTDKEIRKRVEESLEIDYRGYGASRKKKAIVDALIFWKFVQENLRVPTWRARKKFLSNFISFEDTFCGISYMAVVAVVESLPDSLWYQILWKWEMNFVSFESFLYYLTRDQWFAIIRNYQELFERNEIPEVFSWFDRYFMKKISLEELLLEPTINCARRYINREGITCSFPC